MKRVSKRLDQASTSRARRGPVGGALRAGLRGAQRAASPAGVVLLCATAAWVGFTPDEGFARGMEQDAHVSQQPLAAQSSSGRADANALARTGMVPAHLQDINSARDEEGPGPLEQETCLRQQAQRFANALAARDAMDRHNKGLTHAVNAGCGTRWAYVAENVSAGARRAAAWQSILEEEDDSVHDSEQKVLSQRWDFVGVGIAQNGGGSGKYYVVELYADLFGDNVYTEAMPRAGELGVMIAKGAYGALAEDDRRIVDAYYNTPRAFIMAGKEEFDKPGWPENAQAAQMFESTVNFKAPQPWSARLRAAYPNMFCGTARGPDDDHYGLRDGVGINARSVHPDAKAIFYDPEPRCHTPSAEKNYVSPDKNSKRFLEQAPGRIREVAAELRMKDVIAATSPGTGLASPVYPGYVPAKGQGGNYIELGFPEAAARSSDLYEIQSQGAAPHRTNPDVDRFQWMVRSAVMNARAERERLGKPHIPIFAGISPNPAADGRANTYDMCIAAMNAHAWVNGFWFTGLGTDSLSGDLPNARRMLHQLQRGFCSPGGEALKQAFYDPEVNAPSCETTGSACDSGALLQAKAGMRPGEPHAGANAVGDCDDGIARGVYLDDRSVNRIYVKAPRSMGAGVKVDVTAEVHARSNDFVDIYYAPDVTRPAWSLVGSTQVRQAGLRSVTRSHVLEPGPLQGFRVVVRDASTERSSCAGGGGTDQDALVFASGG